MSFQSSYELVPLGEVARFINGDRSTNYPKGDDYVDDGTPFISATELREGRIDNSGVRRISRSAFERLRSGKIQRDDVLFCLRGSIGKIAYVQDDEVGAIASSLVIVRATERIDSRYLFFGMSSQAGQQAALGLNNGAAQPNLSVGELQKIPLPLPPLPIQRRIAGILSAYDELIENSQRRIKILEAMARALYREWFVHFRFPSHESVPRVPSPLGDIPQGWAVEKLGRISKIVLGGTPSRSVNAFWEGGTIPWLKSGKLNDIRVIEGTEYITQAGLEKSATKLMPPKSVLIAITGAILISFLEVEACANQSVIGLHDFERVCPEYVHLNLSENILTLESKMSGSAQQHINKDIVNETIILIPPTPIADAFSALIQPVYEKIKVALFRSTNLRRTRDLLLPRLLSGKIDVEALES